MQLAALCASGSNLRYLDARVAGAQIAPLTQEAHMLQTGFTQFLEEGAAFLGPCDSPKPVTNVSTFLAV